MKSKKLILSIAALLIGALCFAQSHNTGANYNCKLKPGNYLNIEKHPCPGCEAKERSDREVKLANEKREQERIYEEYKRNKEKVEEEREAQRLKDIEDSKSGEVYINMPSSSSSTSNREEEEEESDTISSYSGNYIPERVPTQQEKEAEFFQNANQLMGNIAAQIEADRLEKEAKARREAERIARNRAYGNELIQKYSKQAIQYGDETAVRMTYLGYMNVNEKSTEEGNDTKAMEFLEKINSRHHSEFAKKQLIDDHLRTINYYDHERKRRTRRTFLHTGLGGALIAGSLSSFGDELMSDEMLGADTGPIVLTGTTLLGGYMVLSGLFNSFFIGDYSKSSTEYENAKNRIDELADKNVKVSFSTGYNERTNNLMVGVHIGF